MTDAQIASTFALPGLAVSGKAGVGKTTFCRLLAERLDARGAVAARVSFAAELKLEVFERYGLRKGQPGWRDRAVAHGAWRRETCGEDYWVRRTMQRIRRAYAEGYTPLVDDLRLVGELDAVHEHGMVCARLDAPAHVRAARLRANGLEPDAAFSTDPTECELDDRDDFALRIINDDDCTMGDLRGHADRLVREALVALCPLPAAA